MELRQLASPVIDRSRAASCPRATSRDKKAHHGACITRVQRTINKSFNTGTKHAPSGNLKTNGRIERVKSKVNNN